MASLLRERVRSAMRMLKLRHYDHADAARFVTFDGYCDGEHFRDPEIC